MMSEPGPGDTQPTSRRHTIDTAPLMALAAALIVNSHLERFYPRAFLAADGLLGNSLFFLLSGFGLQMSAVRQKRSFLSYCQRRLSRLYPTLIVCELIFGLIDRNLWQGWHPITYFQQYIYPTHFTYIREIVPFYLLFYFIIPMNSAKTYVFTILLLVIPYLICYIPDARQIPSNWHLSMGSRPGYMHDIAYLQVMLLGGWFGVNKKLLSRKHLAVHFCTAIVLILYFGLKFVMVAEAHFAHWYFLLHLLTFIACGCLLMSMTDIEFIRLYRSIRPLKWFIAFVAALTLEIYITHEYLIAYPWLVEIRFPLNILLLAVLTLLISFAIAQAIRPVKAALDRPKA